MAKRTTPSSLPVIGLLAVVLASALPVQAETPRWQSPPLSPQSRYEDRWNDAASRPASVAQPEQAVTIDQIKQPAEAHDVADDAFTDANTWGSPCDYGHVETRGDFQPLVEDRLWVRSEYLLWWPRGNRLPPLVTTSPAGTTPSNSGVLGQPGTEILLGNNNVNGGAVGGGRFTLGFWTTPCHDVGIEASYLFLGAAATRYATDSVAFPILARPYTDANTDTETSFLAAHPDYLTGEIAVDAVTSFQASEVLLRRVYFDQYGEKAAFLAGYRFAQLDDNLAIGQTSLWTASQGPILAGTTKSLLDAFDCVNQFQGVQIGLAYQDRNGRWTLDSWGKVGLGNTNSRVVIRGQTVTTVPGGQSATFSGGLLAQDTNIGRYAHNEFSVLPEFGVTFGYDITCRLRATIGYNFLYWTKIARAADQIDLGVSQLPPQPPTGNRQPRFPFATTDFLAQGINFGLDYRF